MSPEDKTKEAAGSSMVKCFKSSTCVQHSSLKSPHGGNEQIDWWANQASQVAYISEVLKSLRRYLQAIISQANNGTVSDATLG